jgi:5,10-methylenetetrahydromethanopterin reductase
MHPRQISVAFQTDLPPASYGALAHFTDSLGFDAIAAASEAGCYPAYGPLLLMAPHVRRARLGPADLSPLRTPPADIAASAALLDALAGGRTIIGLALPAWPDDYRTHSTQQASTALQETIDIIHHLHSGRTGGYEGQTYQLAPSVRLPPPLPPRPLPITIGTWGPQFGTLAGRIANEVKAIGTTNPALIEVLLKRVSEGESYAGRRAHTVGIAASAVTVVDEVRAHARDLARQAVATTLPAMAERDPTLSLEPMLVERIRRHLEHGAYGAAARLIDDDLLDCFAFSGTPSDVIAQAEALFDAGATRVEFGTPHGLRPEEGIQLLGERVLPALREVIRQS